MIGLLQEGLYAEGWGQVQVGLLVSSGGQPQTQASLVEPESKRQRKDAKQALRVTMQRVVSNHTKQHDSHASEKKALRYIEYFISVELLLGQF